MGLGLGLELGLGLGLGFGLGWWAEGGLEREGVRHVIGRYREIQGDTGRCREI